MNHKPPVYDVTIIDDVFPHPSSGFRLEEFSAYLSHFENMCIRCSGKSSGLLGEKQYSDIFEEFKRSNPKVADKLIMTEYPYKLPKERSWKTKLVYFCFLSNTFDSLEIVEHNESPFVFELYPGGQFQLNSFQSYMMLERVLRSPCFRKVIVTQDVTRDYLLRNKLCNEDQIISIFGVVTPEYALNVVPHITDGGDDSVLKVCFAAMRYTPTGVDKGYDVFVDSVRQLAELYENIEFHVAGTFDETVIPLGDLVGRVKFHGMLSNEALSDFMQEMDIIVSPNLNNVITHGAFDGFPTGTCTEAGLNGVLILCTDPLGLNNERFKNGEEIEIVEHDAGVIAEKIAYYYHHRDALREIIRRQGKRIRQLYSKEVQVGGRIRVLEQEINCYDQNLKELKTKMELLGKPMKAYAYYSDVPNHFELEHRIEFWLYVKNNGDFSAKIPLGHMDISIKYLWIYILNKGASSICFDAICYDDRSVPILAHNADDEILKTYFFKNETPVFCLGELITQNQSAKSLTIFGRITEMRIGDYEQRLQKLKNEVALLGKPVTAYAYCSDRSDHFELDSRIEFCLYVKNNGEFSAKLPLGHLDVSGKYLWIYVLNKASSRMRFDTVCYHGRNLHILAHNAKRKVFKTYFFKDETPMIYLGEVKELRPNIKYLTLSGKVSNT